MKLRANASLSAVAEAATEEALRAKKHWLARRDDAERSARSREHNLRMALQEEAWARFAALKPLALHLRRLAGLEPEDRL